LKFVETHRWRLAMQWKAAYCSCYYVILLWWILVLKKSGRYFSTAQRGNWSHLPWIAHESTLFKVYIINTWKTWCHDLFHPSKESDEGPIVQPVAWGFFNTYWQHTLHYIGALFYIMTVASHVLSAYLTYKILICKECVCYVWHMSASQSRMFPTPCLIIVNTDLILTAMHWTKMLGLNFMANWNMGKCCAACHRMSKGWCKVECTIIYLLMQFNFRKHAE
jgi:hypothetical protein